MVTVLSIGGAVVVYAVLAGASVLFNRRIDQAPIDRRPDGLTALWVAGGVGYTLAGATALLWLAWPVAALLAERFGSIGGALAVIVVVFSAFVASGAPMVWGDMRRSYGLRTVADALTAARGELRGIREE